MALDRPFFRDERYFRNRAGAIDLVTAPRSTFKVGPAIESAIYNVEGIRFEIVGKKLLSKLRGWGGDSGSLVLREWTRDSFGKLVDQTAFEEWVLSSVGDWSQGAFSAIAINKRSSEPGAEPNAGTLALDRQVLDPVAGQLAGTWTSNWKRLEAAGAVEYVAWDATDAVDLNNNPLRKYSVEIRGRTGATTGAWYMLTSNVVGLPNPYLEMGSPIYDPANPGRSMLLQGNEVQLRVSLSGVDPAIPIPAARNHLLRRPATMNRIKVYSRLERPAYRWGSLSDLLLDSESVPTTFPKGVSELLSGYDFAIVEFPYEIELAGAYGERLELLLDLDPSDLVSVRAIVDGYVEYSKENVA